MTPHDVRTRIYAIVAKTFDASTDEITDATTADDVDGWDSLAHATLLIRIEKTFNVDLGTAGGAAQDLGALIELVLARLKEEGARA